MKIRYITNVSLPSHSAHSIQIMEMCYNFVREEVEVELFVPEIKGDKATVFDFYGMEPIFPIESLSYFLGIRKSLFFALSAQRHIKNSSFVFTRCEEIANLCHHYKINFILELHYKGTMFDKFLYKKIIKSPYLKLLITISPPLEKYFLDRGADREKILVFPDAVDMDDFADPAFFENKKMKEINIGYIGNLYKGRGIDALLGIAKELPQLEVVIVGGTLDDIALWKEKAKKIGSPAIFKGFVPHKEIPRILKNMDILLMPYHGKVRVSGGKGDISEFMSPLKMFEYMASGKPIIASDFPILRTMLKNGKNAILVSPHRIDKWIEAIKFIIDNPDFAQRIGRQARSDVEHNYTWRKRAKAILERITNE